jgi:hypothetical protein
MGNVNEKQSCADGLGLRERDITFGSARVAGSLRRLEADEGLFLKESRRFACSRSYVVWCGVFR